MLLLIIMPVWTRSVLATLAQLSMLLCFFLDFVGSWPYHAKWWKSINSLDARSAIMFSFPGMCAADMYTPLLIQNSQISIVTLLHNIDRTPPCLFMYELSVLLSVITLRCFFPTCSGSRKKMANFIAVSSNNLYET